MATFKTYEVYADAYSKATWEKIREGKGRFLSHTVEFDDAGEVVRVLCKRVTIDSLNVGFGDPAVVDTKPACPTCARRDPRWPPPLSPDALRVLSELVRAPVPRSTINPGIAARLTREKFAETVDLPSPFKSRKGTVLHLQITPRGVEQVPEGQRGGSAGP